MMAVYDPENAGTVAAEAGLCCDGGDGSGSIYTIREDDGRGDKHLKITFHRKRPVIRRRAWGARIL